MFQQKHILNFVWYNRSGRNQRMRTCVCPDGNDGQCEKHSDEFERSDLDGAGIYYATAGETEAIPMDCTYDCRKYKNHRTSTFIIIIIFMPNIIDFKSHTCIVYVCLLQFLSKAVNKQNAQLKAPPVPQLSSTILFFGIETKTHTAKVHGQTV